MVCQKCSTVNTEDSIFCSECGCRLEKENSIYETGEKALQIRMPNFRNKEVRKKVGLPLLGIAVAVVVASFGYNLISYAFSPENVAEKYFKAICTADWQTSYNMLYINETSFINFEQYVRMMESDKSIPKAVASFEIISTGEKKSGKSVNLVNNKEKNEISNITDLNPKFQIEYTTEKCISDTMIIRLLRTDAKSFIFFPTYRVSCADMLSSCTIYAPVFSDVKLDGITLTKEFEDTVDENMIRYDVDPIFIGEHEVTVESPFTEKYVTSVLEELEISYSNLSLTKELKDERFTAAKQDFMKLFEDASDGVAYEHTSPLYESYLDDFVNVFYNTEETGNHDFSINSIRDNTEQNYLYSGLSYTCTISYDYSYQVKWFDEEKQPYEEVDEDGNVQTRYKWVEVLRSDKQTGIGYANLTYTYDDGKWNLFSISNTL